jgi:hypothetical protein
LILGLAAGLGSRQIDERDLRVPNEGIRRSLKNGLLLTGIAGLGTGLGVGLAFYTWSVLVSYPWNGPASAILFGLSYGAAIGAVIGLGGGLAGGLGACIQHWALRRQLQRAGSMPRRYVSFLNFCADHILLQRVGGGYRFTHALLLDYFATLHAEGARDIPA